ncbi:MAG: NADPH-dependent 7-cyano-7-deazaguanine reductase QueF [Alcanivoracaceae bacterium]|nr:NADPH-dependent 7-cyano-7-deazaguanine reductase QueF [Alcanivoracaceae bacterium]
MASPLSDTPLGRKTDYVDTYTPALLCPVPRWDAREDLELVPDEMPFHGIDIWHAYEISWLDERGKPMVAVGQLRVPCHTANLIESKSLKLYLNSFANTAFPNRQAVAQAMENDLSECAGGAVDVRLQTIEEAAREGFPEIHATSVDRIELDINQYEYDPALLRVDQGAPLNETLYSHLLRSRCPVTGQPDWATVFVRYSGEPISHAGFLRYLVSLRNHQGFHEQVIERIFVDIKQQCRPRHLSVFGRFTRRGGLDINPFRSDFEDQPVAGRVSRQ